MYCNKCGASIPDDSVFCPKCGSKQSEAGSDPKASSTSQAKETVIAASGVTELKCPGCGAPIKPEIGEMLITCEYCGASISLAADGWKSIESNTMLPLVVESEDKVLKIIKDYMDRGFLHRHMEEKSKNEALFLTIVPYWIVPVSARTKYTAVDVGVEVGKVAGTAILAGMLGGAMGGRGRGGFGSGLLDGTLMGGVMMGGFSGGSGGSIRAYSLDQNYNYPVVAVKGLLDYQPNNYAFNLQDRVVFDASKLPKGIKVLNGYIGEDSAKYEAKTNVDQIQSQKVHQQHHSVRSMSTDVDITEPELLHVPVWFAKFDSSGKKIVLVIDGHSGKLINSIGLD